MDNNMQKESGKPEPIILAYQNGRADFKAELIEKLKILKGRALGVSRSTIDEVLQMVQKMEA